MASALLLAAVGPAQSLGELARRQREQKRPPAKAERVYTEDNLPRAGGLSATGTASASASLSGKPVEKLAPFVPSPEAVVQRMLELAQVGPDDVVYDLGCGDGRILFMAAQKFGARAVGVELDESLYKETSKRARQLNLEDRVKIIHGDLLETDLSPATVVTLYLLTSANEKVRPNLEKYLQKGARVVSHDFEVPGWKADKVELFEEKPPRSGQHTLYLYRR